MKIKRFQPRILIEQAKYNYASTQFNVSKRIAELALDMNQYLQDEDLTENGRENEPHVTIRYGLDKDCVAEVLKRIIGIGPIQIRYGDVSLFERDDFDVVKVDVISDDIHHLNNAIKDLALKDDFAATGYHPHLTLGYVKAGKGKKYLDIIPPLLKGRRETFVSFFFCDTDGEKYKIKLHNG